MWILLYLAIASFTIFLFSGKIIDKLNTTQIELDDYNTLLKCENCGKFHRKYQEELEMRISDHYSDYLTCPRCHGPSNIYYEEEEYEWMKTNPDCPKLSRKDLRTVKKALNKVEKLTYNDKAIEKFLYYHSLIPEQHENNEKHLK